MFVFKLQSVLNYRINVEEKILDEFSEKRHELEMEKMRLTNLIRERTNLIEELRKMQNKTLSIDDVARYVSYIEQVRDNEKKQKVVILRVTEELEAKRRELLEAVKKKKVMEKLKERQKEEYEGTERVLEQKNFDEIAVLKFGRRAR